MIVYYINSNNILEYFISFYFILFRFLFYRLDLFCLEGSFLFSVNNDINLFRIIKTNKIIANSLFDENLGNEIHKTSVKRK